MNLNIEERVQAARTYFGQGYNCAQAVAMAYADFMELDEELVARMAISFGGGFGRQKDVCGAVTGASFLFGFKSPIDLKNDVKGAKELTYERVQLLSQRFRKENGSILCSKLLALGNGTTITSTPEEGEVIYKRRPCVEYVASSARIIGEMFETNAAKSSSLE